MSKRLIWFLVLLTLVLGWTLVAPVVDHSERVKQNTGSSPSPSVSGYKGLYRLFSKVQSQPVSFWPHSIMRLPENQPRTVWFINPGKALYFDGENYANQMQSRVRNGDHFVFVMTMQNFKESMRFLRRWYDIEFKVGTLPMTFPNAFPVKSYFSTRTIRTLKQDTFSSTDPKNILGIAKLIPGTGGRAGETLLTAGEEPLVRTYSVGKGAVTLVSENIFFENRNLGKADNAALALAIQERFPDLPVLIETHSSGFTDNPNILFVLASGKGFGFLLTCILLLIAFCVWIINQRVFRVNALNTSDERYFMQEVFIEALARHYLATGQWQALYQKLVSHFLTNIEKRYPELSVDQAVAEIAQNPFYNVSLEALQTVLNVKTVRTEAQFTKQSQQLFKVERKVFRYESPASFGGLAPARSSGR